MAPRSFHRAVVFFSTLICLSALGCAHDLHWFSPVLPEQRTLEIRHPSELVKGRIPDAPPPRTVSDPQLDSPARNLTLDDAIRIAMENTEAVRVLAGVQAVASGRTIYDAAISNTSIDQEQARFDPWLEWENVFDRNEVPRAEPLGTGAIITGERVDGYRGSLGVSQTNALGGTAKLSVDDTRRLSQPRASVLNPENRHSVTLSYTQPLLLGGGIAPNVAPIVIARINTERSYFQFKSSMQDSVRGVIEAYWALVFARTDEWARRQQVQQGTAAQERAEARRRQGLGSAAEVAQTRLALANFRAALIAAESNVIQREAALRNIMGLPPSGTPRLIPITPPTADAVRPKWDEIVRLSEERRPDIIELKLAIEADQQRLLQAQNAAMPRVDMTTFYRWNGLEGKAPDGTHLTTQGSEYTDWSLGVNFSVPLGLRQGRAALRQQELILARDWANLEQGLHSAIHDLATSTRSVAQFYAQYEANREARQAAGANLEQQAAEFRAGRAIFLNVLQAITDWGNAVSAEAQALAQYNSELANLERESGTILETHGIVFHEERLGFVGPCGCLAPKPWYPASHPPSPNAPLYPAGKEPAENFFDLKPPGKRDN
jgi:outer membrane protein TolC